LLRFLATTVDSFDFSSEPRLGPPDDDEAKGGQHQDGDGGVKEDDNEDDQADEATKTHMLSMRYGDTLFFFDDTRHVLGRSKHAKALGNISVNAADLVMLQAGLEALMWQSFDREMEASGANRWLHISVAATGFALTIIYFNGLYIMLV